MTAGKPLRVALYLRVSTDTQTTDNQELELRAVAEQRGWHVVRVFQDQGISGAKSRAGRPGLDELLTAATRGGFDLVACWALDRLGRSTRDLLDSLASLQACGVELFFHAQAIDTTTPAGRLFFTVAGAFAEFERSLIVERVRAGMARAKLRGTKSGARIGRPRVPAAVRRAVLADLAGGMSARAVARARGLGNGTVAAIRDGAEPAA